MEEWITPGRVIGIIGKGGEAYQLTQAALSMGYKVFVYNDDEADMAGSISDEHWLGSLHDYDQLKAFARTCNLLVYTTRNIGNEIVHQLMEDAYLPQGDEIISLSQDQALQKASFDSLNINVLPYATALNKDDVKQVADSIGFPVTVSANFSVDHDDSRCLIREEADIDQLDDDLLSRTSVVESFLDSAKHLSLIVAVDVFGQVHPAALFETTYRNHRLRSVINPPSVEADVALETFQVAQRIAEAFNFVGLLTVDFVLSDLGILYVQDIKPFTSSQGASSLDSQNLSQYELFIRTVTNWPIPPVEHYQPSLSVPFYAQDVERMVDVMKDHPEGKVYFYNEQDAKAPHGHVTFMSEDVEVLQDKLDQLHF